ncbi:hypothetical protein BC829DRAFT_407416, partial [Chytridium lagenaria]
VHWSGFFFCRCLQVSLSFYIILIPPFIHIVITFAFSFFMGERFHTPLSLSICPVIFLSFLYFCLLTLIVIFLG